MAALLSGGLRKVNSLGQSEVGGRGGIRTHGTVARTSDFESGAFNHSATLPTVDFQALMLGMKPQS